MKLGSIIITILAAAIATAPAHAIQGSKFSTTLSKTALMNETTDASAKVLKSFIHTSNKKELLIGVSLETGVYTQTKVKGKNGSSDESNAWAGVNVTVFVDGFPAEPGTVTFNMREQQMSAVLGGVIESCAFTPTVNVDGTVDNSFTVEEDCIVTDEEIELIQRTMSAHHFNFVAPNLSSGDHHITVKAEIASAIAGSASATALVGKGSMTVESVRAINQDGGITILE
jgi:hypothetical protein